MQISSLASLKAVPPAGAYGMLPYSCIHEAPNHHLSPVYAQNSQTPPLRKGKWGGRSGGVFFLSARDRKTSRQAYA